MSLFATKTIETLVAEALSRRDRGLRRVLGRRDLVGLGVGAVIGAGIFVLTGQAAAAHAGPAIVLSMAIAGLVERTGRPLLRGVRLDRSGVGVGLHLRVRDARRDSWPG